MAEKVPLEQQQSQPVGVCSGHSCCGDQFIASLNHDVRTPLSGIVGMTDLLLETELDDEQREYVNTTKLCADQLMEMLNSALEYAAISSGNVRLHHGEFHLPRMLESLVDEYLPKAEAKKLSLQSHMSPQLPEYVIGDEVRMRQALSPILANAVKFTQEGGIELNATASPGSNGSGASLRLSVRDTGIGIPQDKLEVIFESFRQLESGLSRSYAGMGLGLAVARSLSRMMGGEIEVESAPGSGSAFVVQVPIRLPKSALSAPADKKPADTGPRILLVDDNEVARRIVTHILSRAEYGIDCAEGGPEGIEAARQRQYSLILMDLQMPVINGLEATAEIRKIPGYRDTPIFALTANYSDEFMQHCTSAGLQGFLAKPIQRGELLRTIARHLPSNGKPAQ